MWIDQNLTPIADDATYTDAAGRSYSGAWPKSDIPGLRQVVPTPRPDDRLHEVLDWCVVEIDGVPTQVWNRTAKDVIAVLTAYLAERRWKVEVQGTTWNGWKLATDRDSQAKYMAEMLAVEGGIRQDGDPWKFSHGFEPLTNDQVVAMANAVRRHVLGCYALEGAMAGRIAAGDITGFNAIDAAFTESFPPPVTE